jgi:hypothetical protein
MKHFSRDNRRQYFGLVNEPRLEKAPGPDPDRFGPWLDKGRAGCPAHSKTRRTIRALPSSA